MLAYNHGLKNLAIFENSFCIICNAEIFGGYVKYIIHTSKDNRKTLTLSEYHDTLDDRIIDGLHCQFYVRWRATVVTTADHLK